MKSGILLVLIWIICFNSQAQDSLIYSPDQKLSWQHFQGTAVELDSAAARIACTIQMKIEKVNVWTGVTKFSAWAVMYPSSSWVKEGYKDDYTLNHEQLHFDIAQLTAEKLQTDINKKKINGGNKKKMNRIFNDYLLQLDSLQQQYDLETSGGNNRKMQSQWNSKIRQELAEFREE